MKAKPAIGTIIADTTDPDDLIPAFVAKIREIRGNLPRDLCTRYLALGGQAPSPQEELSRKLDLLDELFDYLEELAPPFCFFGTHPCDGLDFGFWPWDTEDILAEPDAVRAVEDMSEVPADYRGYVLHINDHGNTTLYRRTAKNKDREIWSYV